MEKKTTFSVFHVSCDDYRTFYGMLELLAPTEGDVSKEEFERVYAPINKILPHFDIEWSTDSFTIDTQNFSYEETQKQYFELLEYFMKILPGFRFILSTGSEVVEELGNFGSVSKFYCEDGSVIFDTYYCYMGKVHKGESKKLETEDDTVEKSILRLIEDFKAASDEEQNEFLSKGAPLDYDFGNKTENQTENSSEEFSLADWVASLENNT